MPYNRCGGSGLELPAVSLGLWHNFGGVDVFENARAIIHRAFDLGITHFDLANNYGPPPGSAEEADRASAAADAKINRRPPDANAPSRRRGGSGPSPRVAVARSG